MSDRKKPIIRTPGNSPIQEAARFLKLVWRLLNDSRVHPLLKLIPLAGAVYLFYPFDVPGPVDDAGVVGMSLYLFVELCPQDVVEEHRREMEKTVDAVWREPEIDEDEVIDAEFREK